MTNLQGQLLYTCQELCFLDFSCKVTKYGPRDHEALEKWNEVLRNFERYTGWEAVLSIATTKASKHVLVILIYHIPPPNSWYGLWHGGNISPKKNHDFISTSIHTLLPHLATPPQIVHVKIPRPVNGRLVASLQSRVTDVLEIKVLCRSQDPYVFSQPFEDLVNAAKWHQVDDPVKSPCMSMGNLMHTLKGQELHLDSSGDAIEADEDTHRFLFLTWRHEQAMRRSKSTLGWQEGLTTQLKVLQKEGKIDLINFDTLYKHDWPPRRKWYERECTMS